MPPQVDYDKLAKQHGGTVSADVDYDALAAEGAGERPEMNFAVVNGKRLDPTVGERLQRATGAGPMVGSTVGALVGGVPGAAMGAAAGRGLQDAYDHAAEIPGAVVDVARGMVNNPRATLSGAWEGAKSGATDAALAAGLGGAMEYGGQVAMNTIGGVAKSVYRGYLKPSLAGQSIGKAQQIVETALREALPIAQSGVDKGKAIIGELRSEVTQILQNRQNISRNLHGDIDLHDIAERVRKFARDKYYKAGRPAEDFEAAMRVADNIDAHPSLNVPPGAKPGPTPVDLTKADEVKTALRDSAGDRAFGVERTPAQEAEKRGAFEIRTDIESRAPKVAPLNKRESQLIDTAKAIARAVERESNQNSLVGVKTVLATGAGGVEYGRTGDPWTAAAKALALRAALTPEAASRMAIIAYRIGKLPGVAPASAARLALAAISESQADE